MPMMVSIVRRSHVLDASEMKAREEAFSEIFGACADVPKFLPDSKDKNLVALVGDVHDVDELRRISRTPEGDDMMRKFGFLEQLNYFLEEA